MELIEEKTYANKYSCWIKDKENEFIPSITTVKTLPPGKYRIKWNSPYGKYSFIKEDILLDELLLFPNSTFNEILNDINYFWDNKALFEKYKYTYKRGILLYGPPGCGKSSLIALLSGQVINRGGIVLSIQNYNDLENYFGEFPNSFRVIQPNTPVLVIFEDLDALVRSSDSETLLLNILDGLNQTNNIVNIGCTNYPENLKERILNRPSRFDKRYKIDKPDEETREFYFKNKIHPDDLLGEDEYFISKLAKETDGFSLAHLGEFIKSVYIFKNNIDDTLRLLKNMSSPIKSDTQKEIGFKS